MNSRPYSIVLSGELEFPNELGPKKSIPLVLHDDPERLDSRLDTCNVTRDESGYLLVTQRSHNHGDVYLSIDSDEFELQPSPNAGLKYSDGAIRFCPFDSVGRKLWGKIECSKFGDRKLTVDLLQFRVKGTPSQSLQAPVAVLSSLSQRVATHNRKTLDEHSLDRLDRIRNDLKTGDIVLSTSDNLVSEFVKSRTNSQWSHVGIVLRSSDYGVFVWESAKEGLVADLDDPNRRIHGGVQISLLSEWLIALRSSSKDARVAIRHLTVPGRKRRAKMEQSLSRMRQEFRGRTYEWDFFSMLCADNDELSSILEEIWGGNKEDLSSLFCSELVAEAYFRMGNMKRSRPANQFVPSHFSSERELELSDGIFLGSEIEI